MNTLMNDCYHRIISGKPYDTNFKSYTKKYLLKVNKYFEDTEEYEKCKTLLEFININFDHERRYTI